MDRIIIQADEKEQGYVVDIKQKNGKCYRLKSGEKNYQFLAPYRPFWKLNIRVVDINNDKLPEIITWGSMTKENEYLIFEWNGLDYKLIFKGVYSGLKFSDTTGDNVPEILAERFYSSGTEYFTFQWQKGKYQKIVFDINEVQGMAVIQQILSILNFPAETNNIFDHPEILKSMFTDEWVENADNIRYLKKLKAEILSIRLSEYIDVKIVRDINVSDVPVLVNRKFKVKILGIQGVRLQPYDKVMQVEMKLTDNYKNKYKINSFKIE